MSQNSICFDVSNHVSNGYPAAADESLTTEDLFGKSPTNMS